MDKKHVIALYEFSMPVQGVKTRGYILKVEGASLENMIIKTTAFTTNGVYQSTESCQHECTSASQCDIFERCESNCCSTDWAVS